MKMISSFQNRGCYGALALSMASLLAEAAAAEAQNMGARPVVGASGNQAGTTSAGPQPRPAYSNRNYLGYNGTQGPAPQFTGKSASGLNGFLITAGFGGPLNTGIGNLYGGGFNSYGGIGGGLSPYGAFGGGGIPYGNFGGMNIYSGLGGINPYNGLGGGISPYGTIGGLNPYGMSGAGINPYGGLVGGINPYAGFGSFNPYSGGAINTYNSFGGTFSPYGGLGAGIGPYGIGTPANFTLGGVVYLP
jgi:hypothetical protein